MSDFIKACSGCPPHEFQDTKYGKGVRVHTRDKDGNPASCTVCGRGGRTRK